MLKSPHMQQALDMAQNGADAGEVPVGAVVLGPDGQVLAQTTNRTRRDNDPTAHAEVLAIRQAARALGQDRLAGCALYVTLEPCAMCAAAIAHARIERVVFAADDPKSGGTIHGARVFDHAQTHHKPEVLSGIMATQAKALLKDFFAAKRSKS